MEAQCVYLTTDADGNDAANAFYRDAGFQHTRRFLQRKGRWMNEYVIHRHRGRRHLRNSTLTAARGYRRLFDVTCAAAGLLLLTPVLAALALADSL